jgi:hypothetical protein
LHLLKSNSFFRKEGRHEKARCDSLALNPVPADRAYRQQMYKALMKKGEATMQTEIEILESRENPVIIWI